MNETAFRREPRQPRGQRRVESILDAAERLFAEIGYAGATTNAIAARAETSVGSLYQFFPNKEAIVQGLADRYLQQLCEVYAQAFHADALNLPLREWIARTVDLLIDLQEANPGFTAIFCDLPLNSQAVHALYAPLIGDFDALLARRAPEMDPAQRAVHVQVSVTVLKSLLQLTAPLPPASSLEVRSDLMLKTLVQRTSGGARARDTIVPEIKALLVRYLEPLFGAD